MTSNVEAGLIAFFTAVFTYPVVEILRGVNAKRASQLEYKKNQLFWARRFLKEFMDSHESFEPNTTTFRSDPNMLFLERHLSKKCKQEFMQCKLAGEWKYEPSQEEWDENELLIKGVYNQMIKKVVELESRWLMNSAGANFYQKIRNIRNN